MYGRDGFLTALDVTGKWWAGCSLPLAAGRAMLKSLEPSTLHNCFLDPTHAGLLRAAFESIGDTPSLMAVVPELATIRIILCCDDFSSRIAARQLWFISGENWTEEFRRLLEERPGLCTPGRFIRTKLISEAAANVMITQAQNVFSEILQQRTRRIEEIRVRERIGHSEKVLLIGGSHFRLWDDASNILAEQIQSTAAIERFDSDDPAASSPIALAEAAAGCGAILAANISRTDANNIVATATPWITWITWPRIPSFVAAGPRDVLLLADAAWKSMAVTAGWPAQRLSVAPWPSMSIAKTGGAPSLAIIADTQLIEIPESIADLSSHRLLWDQIEAELRDDPLALGEDIGAYLTQRAETYDVSPSTLDRRQFVENLIVPVYQQGLARLLLKGGLSLRLHGNGWNAIEEFSKIDGGPVRSQKEFEATIAAASALIYVWPIRHAHPIDTFGKPIIQRTGRRAEAFIAQAKAAIKAKPVVTGNSSPRLGQAILKLLSSFDGRGYDVAAA